jgi:hypothetical protein
MAFTPATLSTSLLAALLGGALFTTAAPAGAEPPDHADAPARRVASIDPPTRTDASPAPDAPSPPPDFIKGFQIESGVASSSIFRGRPMYASRFDASNQTTAALSLAQLGPGTLTLTAWNATALMNFEKQPGTALEVDLTAAYTFELPASFEASLGYLVYLFPKAAADQHVDGAHEVFATLQWNNPIITPKVSVFGEVVRQMGVYASLAGTHSFELGPVTIAPSASLGFAAYRDVPAQINDLTASVAGQWTFYGPGYVALRGAVSYLAGPTSSMPMELQTTTGRTVPWAMLAVGAQK